MATKGKAAAACEVKEMANSSDNEGEETEPDSDDDRSDSGNESATALPGLLSEHCSAPEPAYRPSCKNFLGINPEQPVVEVDDLVLKP